MKLELKHLAPYLPYELRLIEGKHSYVLSGGNLDEWFNWGFPPRDVRPILRPLSDITKEIEHNGEEFFPLDKIRELFGIYFDTDLDLVIEGDDYATSEKYIGFKILQNATNKLFEWHFDVFGLIEAGLAIDINTLEKHQNKIK